MRGVGPALIAASLFGGMADGAVPTLNAADRLAITLAAGLTVKAGTVHNECDAPAEMLAFDAQDLNGDGRPEMIVSDGGACYGNGGSWFAIVTRDPAGGRWTQLFSAQGMAVVLDTSRGGWRDIEIGGPGMGAMPVARWNGRRYVVP